MLHAWDTDDIYCEGEMNSRLRLLRTWELRLRKGASVNIRRFKVHRAIIIFKTKLDEVQALSRRTNFEVTAFLEWISEDEAEIQILTLRSVAIFSAGQYIPFDTMLWGRQTQFKVFRRPNLGVLLQ